MKELIKDLLRPFYKLIMDRKWREFYKLSQLHSGKGRFIPSSVKFSKYKFQVPDLPSFLGQYKELFIDEIYRFDAVNDTPYIIDVGSNIGLSLIYFKELYPKSSIVAFEADPKVFDYLKKNIESCKIDSVQLMNQAIWIDNNGVNFSSEGADGGTIKGSTSVIKIPSRRLKDLLDSNRSIDFLKIDIEGAEVDVLKDCRGSLKNVRNIFIEYHSFVGKPQSLSEILSILEENRFRYSTSTISGGHKPFVKKVHNHPMDFQLNIFGINESFN